MDVRGDAPLERVQCAGAIVLDANRLLLVRRANEPAAGMWSLPGGRVHAGEDIETAVVREVHEETGLRVEVLHTVGTVELPAGPGRVYAVDDLACRVVGGALRAGDDASAVGWFDPAAVERLPCSPGLLDTLRGWGVLPG